MQRSDFIDRIAHRHVPGAAMTRRIASTLVGYAAVALLVWFDWRVGLAAFLWKWADQMHNEATAA